MLFFIKLFKIPPIIRIMNKIDVVIPNKNEDDLIDMALELGYKEVVLLSEDINYRYSSTKIQTKTGFLIKDTSQISRARKNFNYIFANAERKFFETNIDFIINAELSDKKDSFHYKNTSLNQVHAKLAKEKNTTIVFNFNLLLNNSGRQRNIHLGRMMQNAVIIKKYKIHSELFSFARNPFEMRSNNSFEALRRVLG
jgi:hypothetical protein